MSSLHVVVIPPDHNMKAEYEQIESLQCRSCIAKGATCFINRHWKENYYSISGMSALLYDHISLAQYQQGRLPNVSYTQQQNICSDQM